MTLSEIQREVAGLGAKDRQQLAVFLKALHLRDDPSYRKEIEEAMNDKRPEAWMPLAEAKRRLGDEA